MTNQEAWEQSERLIVSAWMTGNVEEALRQIENVLEQGDNEAKAGALVYRGSIREEVSNWDAAKSDFVEAVGLFPPGSYRRYTTELSVGHVCQKQGELREAVLWYRVALATCACAHEPFSGAAATKALLTLEPVLKPADVALARGVTIKSWRVLGLEGEPDLDDLARTAETLIRLASRPGM